MEAESSVIKSYPSLPIPKSAACHNVHPRNEKFQVNAAKSHSANHRAKSSQSGNTGRRSSTSQGRIRIQQGETRNLIPVNIRHRYGSSVVDQLVSPEQVRSCMREEERTQCRQEYCIPRLRMTSYFMEDYPHKIYYELSHCLRSNLFPGVAIKQHSLVQDSYTAEVNERGRLENTHQWYGRKTDELGRWHERNFNYFNLKKAVAQRSREPPK
ncbi:ciliary microtubule inner protein 4 [Leptodactylus fuscus]